MIELNSCSSTYSDKTFHVKGKARVSDSLRHIHFGYYVANSLSHILIINIS